MAREKRYVVRMESPDGKHFRRVTVMALSEEDARWLVERQEQSNAELQVKEEGKAEDELAVRKAVEKLAYVFADVVEAV